MTSALPLLACAQCAGELVRIDGAGDASVHLRVIGCSSGHRFDVARQGYVSLLRKGSRTDTGDSADMVTARLAFLGAGHYRPIAEAVADLAGDGPVLDLGGGTGYYLGGVLHRLGSPRPAPAPIGVAVDASRFAARRAASAHPGIGSIVADAWSALPVRDAVIGTVLSVFAPRDAAEIDRVLTPAGRLVAVTPEPDHLAEIRSHIALLDVEPGKSERLAAAFEGRLSVVDRVEVRTVLHLTRPDVSNLVRMGPTARHLDPDALARTVAGLDATTSLTLAVTISVLSR